MSKQNPRVALTVSEELNTTLEKLSQLQGIPKSRFIVQLLEEYKPILDKMVQALEQLEIDKENGAEIVKEFGSSVLLDANEQLGKMASEFRKL